MTITTATQKVLEITLREVSKSWLRIYKIEKNLPRSTEEQQNLSAVMGALEAVESAIIDALGE